MSSEIFLDQILTSRDGFCNEVNFHFSSTNGTTQADDVEELELFSIHFHRRVTTSEFQKYGVVVD